jgi:uncharacterized membrane protein YkoI
MRVLLIALAATASLVATASLAATAPAAGQTVGVRSTPDINLTGFSGDATALPGAVSAIEKLSGGRVAEIRFDNIDGVPGYDVALVQGNHMRFQRYAAPSHRLVTFTEAKTPSWLLDWRSFRNMNIVRNAKVPLADAIRTASGSMRGAPAAAAGISRGASSATTRVHAYNVAVVQNGALQRVAVNSETGNVIANPQALPHW